MEKALLIEFDPRTGVRTGGINPRDQHLACRGWQNLDSEPALEIRLIDDGRDLTPYQNVKGVTILEGKDAINAAIQEYIPIQYAIQSETLMLEHMKEKNLSLSLFVGKNMNEIAKMALELGLAGVSELKPRLLE